MALIDVAAAKQQLNIPAANTSMDAEIQVYVTAVTAAVEIARGEAVDLRQFTDELTLRQSSSFLLTRAPAVDLVSVATVDGGTSWDVADLSLYGPTGRVTVVSGAPVDGLVRVVYTAGYATVPPNYQLAARLILQHLWETQRGATATVSGMVVGSEETYDPRSSYSIPRRALELLGAPLPGVA